MITIVSGTNRNNSLTYKICVLYQQILQSLGSDSEIVDLNGLPADFVVSALYENSGKNPVFNRYREQMKSAEKYVFVVPEYNNSFPGVLKAFIDGMEYPNTFTNKKCALVGLSSGIQGGGLALSHLTDIFNYCGMHVLALKPKLARIEAHLNTDFEITNKVYVDLLKKQAALLLEF